MHLWSSDYIGGDNDGYDISKRGFFPGLSAVRPKPAGTSNDGWEISTSENADWGAPTSSKVRSSTTASKVASSTSSMAPRGVVPALVSGPVFAVPTPFKGEEHQVDEGALTASLTFLKAGGVQNIIACGASGEFSSLTVMERQRVTAVCASVFPTATFANISAASCEDAVALEQQAQWVGCISTLLSAPLDSNNTSEQGVEAFLGEVLGRTSLPCFLHNLPANQGSAIPAEMVLRLAKAFPNKIRGVQDSSANMKVAYSYEAAMSEAPHLFAARGQVLVGNDAQAVQTLEVGLAASVTGACAGLPEVLLDLADAHRRQDLIAAERCQAMVVKWHALVADGGKGEVPCAKVAMMLRMQAAGLSTGYGSECRAPLASCTSEEHARIHDFLTSNNLLGAPEMEGMLSSLAATLRAAVAIGSPVLPVAAAAPDGARPGPDIPLGMPVPDEACAASQEEAAGPHPVPCSV